ncbi:hypothetical protein [Xylanimonas sp. McL0601]|uniref:hypothetical protein n=1 Tax=Xylanimonas sp. McL0601 TaxID=3414739 RepID=UPI003CFA9C7C
MFDQASQHWEQDWQQIVNELPVPARRTQVDCDIPVTALIVWERDGEEQLATRAVAYTTRAVLVEVLDRRRWINCMWLAPADVRRRWTRGTEVRPAPR